jgi:NAD(P)-dependent dehydrogenase (short-subunit alcohol dehydrogenase family)
VLAGDMADPSVAPKAVELATSRWGRLDGVVVNHGTLEPVKKVGDGSVEEWRKAFDVNVFSAVGLVSSFFQLFIVVMSAFSLDRGFVIRTLSLNKVLRMGSDLSNFYFFCFHSMYSTHGAQYSTPNPYNNQLIRILTPT